MNEIKIESGIPLPRRYEWAKIFQSMKIGDSFLVDSNAQAQSAAVSAARFGMKLCTRRQEDGKTRVWRIE